LSSDFVYHLSKSISKSETNNTTNHHQATEKWYDKSINTLNNDKIDKQEIIIPICNYHHHYLIHIKDNKLFIYDSFNDNYDENLLKIISKYLEKKELTKINSFKMIETAKQKDGVSCGIYLLYYAYCILNDANPKNQINPLVWRRFLDDIAAE
jgi:succinate dehydrogenase flavin-adding protein (antitoxin of CptAB toxin-antitoxin module)